MKWKHKFVFLAIISLSIFLLFNTILGYLHSRQYLSTEPFKMAAFLGYVIIVFYFLCREKILNFKPRKYETKTLWLIIPLFFILYVIWQLKHNSFYYSNFIAHNNYLRYSFANFFVLFPIIVAIIFGIKNIKEFYKKTKKGISLTGIFSLFIVGVWELREEIANNPFFLKIITKSAYFLLQVFSGNVFIDITAKQPIIGINDFLVSINKSCSGIDSIVIFSAAFLLIAAKERRSINLSMFMPFFFLGIVGLFFVNILRITVLILVGGFYSPNLSVGLFHTNAGWVLFLAYFFVMMTIFERKVKK